MIASMTTYHHGDLPAALKKAARVLLHKEGIEALSLRAVTRHVGVSATAATPHFGNLCGLRSAIAAEGYDELANALIAASPIGPHAAGMAYLDFALANPDLFRLMFRRSLLDFNQPALATASARAFDALRLLAGAERPEQIAPIHETGPARMAGLWGRVHGLAMLAIDGMLTPFLNAQDKTRITMFLEAALSSERIDMSGIMFGRLKD